ncbi:hypothetical protein GCM10025762_16050 [Haloechinothrix salitolerans]
MLKSLVAVTFGAILAGSVSACGTSTEPTDSPAVTPTPTVDVTTEAEPQTSAPAKAKMPPVKGTNLQVSVHKLERLGFTDIMPLPVDGHAFAANYANWKIVGQDPAAGKRVRTNIEVTLEVVKTDEAENSFCFDNDC